MDNIPELSLFNNNEDAARFEALYQASIEYEAKIRRPDSHERLEELLVERVAILHGLQRLICRIAPHPPL